MGIFVEQLVKKKRDSKDYLIILAGIIGALLVIYVLGALMFSMLLAWTPRSASMIEGVQGRYLLPFLPAVLLTFRSSRVVRTGSDDRGLLYAVMMMDLYVAVRIFAVVCLRL